MRFDICLQFLIISCSFLGILCLTDIARSSNGNTVADHLPKLDGRIVNGSKADVGQFPHQVSLRRSYFDKHFCGGSVIADQWILTAAHCMFKSNGVQILPSSVFVVAGQLLLQPKHPLSQKRAVEAIIVHPAFDSWTLTNDVALMKLKIPLILNTSSVKAAKLEKTMPKPGTVCDVSGWGYLAEDKTKVSNNLMYVSLPLINQLRCRKLLVNVTHLPLGMFCAGYEEGLRDACQGDSGGGMMCDNVLSGIVSGGEGCARPALPGLYTNVAYYRNWMENQMKNFNGTTANNSTSDNDDSDISWRPYGKSSSLKVHSSLSFYSFGVAYTLLSYLSVLFCNRL